MVTVQSQLEVEKIRYLRTEREGRPGQATPFLIRAERLESIDQTKGRAGLPAISMPHCPLPAFGRLTIVFARVPADQKTATDTQARSKHFYNHLRKGLPPNNEYQPGCAWPLNSSESGCSLDRPRREVYGTCLSTSLNWQLGYLGRVVVRMKSSTGISRLTVRKAKGGQNAAWRSLTPNESIISSVTDQALNSNEV